LFVNALSDQGVKAYSTHKELGRNPTINKETVTQLVKKLEIDAIIVTRLDSVEVEIDETVSRSSNRVQKPQFQNLTDVFVYEYQDISVDLDMSLAATVSLSTELFFAKNGELLLQLKTTSFKRTDKGTIETESIEKLVQYFKKSGVLERVLKSF
jgi:hypothetical protein